MPSFCGLPCCGTKDKRHSPEEPVKVVEKPVLVAVPVHSSTTASYPARRTSSLKASSAPEKKESTSPSDPNNTTSSNSEKPNVTVGSATQPEQGHTPIKSDSDKPTNGTDGMEQLKGAAGGVSDTVSSGAQQASSGVQSAASTATNTVSGGADKASSPTEGTEKWNAMSEEQKKATYDALPSEKKQNLSYYEWIAQGYHNQKENWMPWVEDMYLRWFTKDNKASYATKDTLDKSKVTGVEQVDQLQDGVNNLVAGQVGQGGLLQPVGDAVSKEGVNRAERGGKDDSGSYLGAAGSTLSSAGGSVWSGAKGAGSYVGGMFGGKSESKEASK